MILILLQGLPASGKTTIGREVAQTLGIPFLSKDMYKEALFDALPNKGNLEWSQAIGAASFDILYVTLEAILEGKQSCVVETFWNPDRATPRIVVILEKNRSRLCADFLPS